MLIICYGIPKSGSTLTYELVRGMLINGGFSQDLENRNTDIVQQLEPRMKRNFSSEMGRAEIEDLLAKIGPEGRVAVKTHAWFGVEPYSWLDAMCEKGEVLVVASYRDPRDIALSLNDAAQRARDAGGRAFANLRDVEHAAKKVANRIDDFRIWGSLPKTVRVDYDQIAFRTAETIDTLERALGFACNREQVLHYLFEDARTLKNKAKPHRHEDELDAEQRSALDARYRVFLRRVMKRGDSTWFDKMREKMLARESKT